MTLRRFAPLALLALAAGCAPAPAASPAPTAGPLTRPERSGYTQTSSYADVVGFLDTLRARGAAIHVDTLGTSTEGRVIPYVVASRPLVRTAEEARRLGRPVVYLQGNIHAGEVEGKEALQALLRDLTMSPGPNVLDSLVLVVVPIYNADGNEAMGPQERQRSEQNGPALVGQRPNAQGLDLNRDYMKAEAPETRGALALFREWAPELIVDLHTTNGSYHGYALTYSPSLNPASGAAGAYTRDRLLPELRRRVRERRRYETFDYGNFSLRYGADVNTDSTREGWFTYDHRPRFGTNYYGLRGGLSVLGEAFSHDPFERRVKSTYAFVAELLSLVAERSGEVMAYTGSAPAGAAVPVRSELTRSPYVGEVLAEILEADSDSVPDEPGVHPGIRRTGRFRALRMPVYDRFDPTLQRTPPAAYLLDASQTDAVALLRRHGIEVEALSTERRVRGQAFVVDSVARAPRPFQGHNEVSVRGSWQPVERTAPAGSFLVRTAQPLGTLAVYLLDPESDDGLTTWNIFDPWLRPGAEHPALAVEH
ncbi:M14 family metallopeptidase [Longimicrobium sp.]|uniref:M14 family metallopeptidase n=1 Tax=Longimicrobium sp. TaxID=2029185 RepID=UPI002ED7DC77